MGLGAPCPEAGARARRGALAGATPARVARLVESIHDHARHIAAVHTYAVHCLRNNHAISEAVALFTAAREGRREEALRIYRWFLPLLRMDTVPKFVQLIKLVQARTGTGTEEVRPPRLMLTGREREEAEAVITAALAGRPLRS